MFLAKIGEYSPCGIYSSGHIILLFITLMATTVALKISRRKSSSEIKKIIQIIVISLWGLEFFRIGYKIYCGDFWFLESYMPLFFCSIFLYSGIFSAFGKGKVQRAGDVVLTTGSLVGGVAFLLYPSTSLPDYPMLHFVSLHSFLYHGLMVYVGLLMLISGYIKLNRNDIWLYAVSVGILCGVVYMVNIAFDCNLMFISKGFPGVLGKEIYNIMGVFYTPAMILVHMFVPYYVIYGLSKKLSA